MKRAFVVAVAGSLTCCASIVSGTSQNIAFSSSPSGAACSGERAGETVFQIVKTPAIVQVKRTKDDILLRCTLAGYPEAAQFLHSGVAPATQSNALLGGGLGVAVDSMTGAGDEYPRNVHINFVPAAQQPTIEQGGIPSPRN